VKNFILRHNLSILICYLSTLIIAIYFDNVRDQYLSLILIMVVIPIIAHTINFNNFFFLKNSNKLTLFSNILVPITFISVFLLIYDFSYFYKYSVPNKNALGNFITYLVILILTIFSVSSFWKTSLYKNKVFFVAGIIYCFFLAYHSVITDLHRYNENFLNLGVVFNPIIQVFNGGTVLIDVKSQYGMYPHFFEPILRISGISITTISIAFALCLFITLFSWLLFLLKTTKNYFLSLVGLIAAGFASTSYGTTWPGELYYQYFPLRTFFPALLLFFFSYFYDNRNFYNRILISSILSFGIFWNVESGGAAFLAFLVLDLYLEYDLNKKIKLNIKNILKNFLLSILILITCTVIFFTYIKIRSGVAATLDDFFYFQHLYGANCIRGDNIHCSALHNNMLIMIMVYILGTSYGIKTLLSGSRDKLNSGIFIISVFGMGTSAYYFLKGYHISHEGYALYPVFILITLFSSRLYLNFKSKDFLNLYWLKQNYLKLFYLFISIIFINFFIAIFVIGYKENTNFTTTARYHEIIYPNKANNKSIGIIKLDDFESNQYKFDYLKIGDLADGNPKGLFPKWIVKYQKLYKYKKKDGSIRKDLLIFSNYDYFLYLKLNAKAPLNFVNFNHIWYPEIPIIKKGIIENKDIKYIIWDNDINNPIEPKIINEFIKLTKEYFILIEEIYGPYMWFDNENYIGFNKKGWDKNVIRIYKRK